MGVVNQRKLATILLITAFLASSLMATQALTVEDISKPFAPEFTVKTVAHPYDVPPKTTTTIDQYTGKETTTITPGYHVENKSIEVQIKNQPFIPYAVTNTTIIDPEWEPSRIYIDQSNRTVNLFYDVQVKGHYSQYEDWKTVYQGQYDGTGRQPIQYGSEYTIITVQIGGYPSDATLDFRVKTIVGFYVPFGAIITKGYTFYGQESGWSDIQTISLPDGGVTITPYINPTPVATNSPTITDTPTQNPPATPTLTPTTTNIQPVAQTGVHLGLSLEQIALILMTVIIVALIATLFLYKRKLNVHFK